MKPSLQKIVLRVSWGGVENLSLCLGEGLSSMLRHKVYDEAMCKSWNLHSSQTRLKSLRLQTLYEEGKFNVLLSITRNLSPEK